MNDTPNPAELRAAEAVADGVKFGDALNHDELALRLRSSLHLDEVREAIQEAIDFGNFSEFPDVQQKLNQALKHLSE